MIVYSRYRFRYGRPSRLEKQPTDPAAAGRKACLFRGQDTSLSSVQIIRFKSPNSCQKYRNWTAPMYASFKNIGEIKALKSSRWLAVGSCKPVRIPSVTRRG